MKRSGFNSLYIYDNDIKELKEVTSLTVSNYSDVPLKITASNVERTIPAYNPALKVPYYFNIPGDGTYFDLTIKFEYVGAKTTNPAILDYRQYKCE